MNRRDDIYAEPQSKVTGFVFDETVADVFPDMIQRSVPGYATTLAMLGVIAQQYAQPYTHIYDLGCSLGAGIVAMRQRIHCERCTLIGIDNSPAMAARCREQVKQHPGQCPVQIECADILDVAIENAAVVVLNFTLQFIDVAQRASLLQKIYAGLKPGGVLVLSEKIKFADPQQQRINETLHHQFKQANGYSLLEISQKRSALEKVLIPETMATHRERLLTTGFSACDTWFRCFNFVSWVALKR